MALLRIRSDERRPAALARDRVGLVSTSLLLCDVTWRPSPSSGSPRASTSATTHASATPRGILSYCTIALGWIDTVQATKALGRIEARRVRLSRVALLVFIFAFAGIAILISCYLILVDIRVYTFFVGLVMVSALLVAVLMQYGYRGLDRLVRTSTQTQLQIRRFRRFRRFRRRRQCTGPARRSNATPMLRARTRQGEARRRWR